MLITKTVVDDELSGTIKQIGLQKISDMTGIKIQNLSAYVNNHRAIREPRLKTIMKAIKQLEESV